MNTHFFSRWDLLQITKEENISNKSDIYHIDDIWSLDLLEWNNHGPEKKIDYIVSYW